jgi:hypothetical protein
MENEVLYKQVENHKNGSITIFIFWWSQNFSVQSHVWWTHISHPFSSKTVCDENWHKIV